MRFLIQSTLCQFFDIVDNFIVLKHIGVVYIFNFHKNNLFLLLLGPNLGILKTFQVNRSVAIAHFYGGRSLVNNFVLESFRRVQFTAENDMNIDSGRFKVTKQQFCLLVRQVSLWVAYQVEKGLVVICRNTMSFVLEQNIILEDLWVRKHPVVCLVRSQLKSYLCCPRA